MVNCRVSLPDYVSRLDWSPLLDSVTRRHKGHHCRYPTMIIKLQFPIPPAERILSVFRLHLWGCRREICVFFVAVVVKCIMNNYVNGSVTNKKYAFLNSFSTRWYDYYYWWEILINIAMHICLDVRFTGTLEFLFNT